MAHDVFISYSSHDKHVADDLCAALERDNRRCWIAPRDVLPGSNYGEALLRAIEESKILVLVLSTHSMVSPQVEREVERAVSKGIAIVPFRIDQSPLSKSMEYFLSASHWLDASTSPLDRHLDTLRIAVSTLLLGDRSNVGDGSADRGLILSRRGRRISRRNSLMAIGLTIAIVTAGIIYVILKNRVGENSIAIVFEDHPATTSYTKELEQDLVSQLKKTFWTKLTTQRVGNNVQLAEFRKLAGDMGSRFLLVVGGRQEIQSQYMAVELYDSRTASNAMLWSWKYDPSNRSVYSAAWHIAETTTECVRIELSPMQSSLSPAVFIAYRDGSIQLLRGDEEGLLQAEANFQSAVDRDSTFAEGYAALANAQMLYFEKSSERGVSDRAKWKTFAEANARKALQLDSTKAAPYTTLGRLEADQGNKVDAISLFKKALALNPQDPTTLCLLGQIYFSDLGQAEEALRYFSLANQVDPDNNETAMNCILANVALRNYPRAIRSLRDILVRDPGDADAWKNLGYVFERMNMFDSAMTAYRCAIGHAPTDIDAREYFAGSALASRNLASADSILLDGMRINPSSYRLLYHAGLVKLLLGQRNASMHIFAVGLEIAENDFSKNPRNSESLLLIALFQARLGRTSESLFSAKRAFDLDSTNGSIVMGLAELHAAISDRDGMLRWFSKAKNMSPLDFDVSFVQTDLDFAGYSSDSELLSVARQ